LIKAITLLQTSFQLEVYKQSYGAPKLWGIPTLGISGLPLGSPGTKCHLGVGIVARHEVYYKGEGDGFPQVRVVVSLVNMSLPMVRFNTESVQIMH
jgi:hypothetical protein